MQIAEYPIGEAVAGGQRVVTAGAVYSDITTFTGYGATPPAGSPASGTTRVTKLLADDIQCMTGGGGDKLTSFTFSVGNLNAAAVSCMALIRIYADNASTPGTYLYGVNFTCSSFTASSVGLYTFSIPTASQPTIPANGKLWVGIAFMRTTGCTTATQTQLNNMTVGLYTPVDVGSSLDADYLSTANGGTDPNNVFKANNPAGAVRTAPYTTAAARHGYELISTLGACCVSSPTHYCAVMLQNACTAAGGTYLGAATTCSGLDCNGNGIDDKCDIAAGTSQDCNGNGIPDSCDIASGFSLDCQPDGIPDECQLDSPPYVNEGFVNITTLTGAGWYMQNNSNPVGSTGWFQGDTTVFPSMTNDTAYIGANFNNTGSVGTINNWLATPVITLVNGVKLDFYTRSPTCTTCYADRVQVRMSLNGSSTNVGTTDPNNVGDFTTLLLDINPTLVSNGYPQTWTHYTVTISGVASPTSGRLAFRYFVTNGGASGANSNFIGIDSVRVIHAGLPTYDQNQNGIPDSCDPGACCLPSGQCTYVRQSQCSGTWLGLSSTCSPSNPCPQPPAACCFPDGHCEYVTQAQCGGTWLGYGTNCSPNLCPQPTGACCYANYTCAVTTEAGCTGTWLGANVPCTQCPPPPPTGACCYANYTCAVTTEAGCTGTWLGANVPCTQCPPPPPTGACCYANYTCAVTTEAGCTGTWLGADVPCAQCPPPPPPTGACCYANYTCAVTTEAGCTGTWLGADVPCAQCPPPPPPTGACCYANYTCAVTTEAGCTGTWLGADVPCAQCPPPPPPTGACCYANYTCAVTTEAGCTGTWLGADVPCTQCPPPPPPTGACCYANYTCAVTTEAGCTGTWLGADVPCAQCPPPPPPTGACCYANYTCAVTTEAGCTGTWLGADVPCAQCPPPPPPTGACCYANYTCAVTTEAGCTGTWLGADVPCTQCPPPPPPTGACCYANYTCAVTTEAGCTGTWLGADVPCSQCPTAQTGACCTNYVCAIMTQAACSAVSGHWKGVGTTCTSGICFCRGDVNCDGQINYADINPFVKALTDLSQWQAQYPDCPWENCDISGDNNVNYADINPFVQLLLNTGPCP